LLEAAAALELSLGDLVAAGDHALVHVPLLNVPDFGRCAREIDRVTRGAITFTGPYAIASVVGYGLTGVSGALEQVLNVLEACGAAPVALAAGPLRISVTIETAKLDDVQRALHAAFVA
jgi:aspartokinase